MAGKLIQFILQSSTRVKKSVTLFSQVKTLKEKIEQEKGKDHFSVSGLKLIYAGMLQAVFNPS